MGNHVEWGDTENNLRLLRWTEKNIVKNNYFRLIMVFHIYSLRMQRGKDENNHDSSHKWFKVNVFFCDMYAINIYVYTTRVQILDGADCISHRTNTLGKSMNPVILPSAMGK